MAVLLMLDLYVWSIALGLPLPKANQVRSTSKAFAYFSRS